METIKFYKEDLPLKSESIKVRYPRYKDLKQARRLFPHQQGNVPYSIHDLLTASLIESIENEAGQVTVPDQDDVLDRVKYVDPDDFRHVVDYFIRETTIKEEVLKEADSIANSLKDQVSDQSIGIGTPIPTWSEGLRLPSKKERFVRFLKLTKEKQKEALRIYEKYEERNGATHEEAVCAQCIHQVNGKVVKRPIDTSIFDDWELRDVQYLIYVFLNSTCI